MGQSNKEVWIVDDEVDLASAFSEFIGDRYTPRVFNSAHSALKAFDENPSSLGVLVSDIRMPEVDGISLVRSLRERNMKEPVILLSGYLEKESLIRSAALGLWGMLEKPCRPEELRSLIDRAMGSALLERLKEELLASYRSLIRTQKSLLDGYFSRLHVAENLIYERKLPYFCEENERKKYLALLSADYSGWLESDRISTPIQTLVEAIERMKMQEKAELLIK